MRVKPGKRRISQLLLSLLSRISHWLKDWWIKRKQQAGHRANASARLLFEPFEPRLLLSADPLAASAAFYQQPEPANELVIHRQHDAQAQVVPLRIVQPASAAEVSNTPNQFGHIANQADSITLTLTDADGTAVKFKLDGAGHGEVIATELGYNVILKGTDATTVVTLSASGGAVALRLRRSVLV